MAENIKKRIRINFGRVNEARKVKERKKSENQVDIGAGEVEEKG